MEDVKKVQLNEEMIREIVEESLKTMIQEDEGLRYKLSRMFGGKYAKQVDKEKAAKQKAMHGDYKDWERIQDAKRMKRMAKKGTLTDDEYLRYLRNQ